MSPKRREFLLFLGASFTAAALPSCQNRSNVSTLKETSTFSLPFQPVKGPLPLEMNEQVINISTASAQDLIKAYSTYEVVDDLVLPEGFTYDVIATWGDKVGNSRFGYNNDYVSFVATKENEGFLTINFEYISPKILFQSYENVIGKPLPLEKIQASKQKEINVFALPDQDPLKQAALELAQEGLTDLGMGVISLKRNSEGRWVRTYSSADRRITGLSGWKDGNYLKATGPAVAVFRKKKGQGILINWEIKLLALLVIVPEERLLGELCLVGKKISKLMSQKLFIRMGRPIIPVKPRLFLKKWTVWGMDLDWREINMVG